ncbi:hypothetical protein P8605_44905 [Streptomyces sp. T-3]|nr:hypothetical protein [Streptomyces sp. T-3]
MRTVRKLAALVGALVAGAVLVLAGAPAAVAGGVTSVQVTSGTSGEAAAVYYTEEKFRRLEQLLGSGSEGSAKVPPALAEVMDAARFIQVSWLAHDVRAVRVDQVYLDSRQAKDGVPAVWIHTSLDMENRERGFWHRDESPTELLTLLKELGVMGKADKPDAAGADDKSGVLGQQDSAPEAAVAPDGSTDWWWAIPGGAAGAALALALRPLAVRQLPGFAERLRTRDRHEPGPRQELIDS